ncbi:MAG: HEPN domain-containing protein, partial [Minicystis sp.]
VINEAHAPPPMKTSLEHLPADRQEQLTAITALLQAEVPTAKLILFGSHARGDWVDDLVTGYRSDYDLLIVVEDEAQAWDSLIPPALWEQITRIAGRVPVSVIVHSFRELNKEIRAGSYFFIDIMREGIALFDSNRFHLARPKVLGKEERLDLANVQFRKWFESASGFWKIAGHCMGQDLLPHAAFLLHQTAERYFHAALLVFTGYKPRTHDLALLFEQTAPLHPALAGALPRVEPEDERLFIVLRKAYIDARYTMSYRISIPDLEALRDKTRDLGLRVREACVEQMATLGAVDPERDLPLVPSADDAGELPEVPPLQSPEAMRAWMNARDVVRDAETFERGAHEGELRGQRRAVLAIFAARGIAVNATVRATIEACVDPVVLEGWIARAAIAGSAEQVVDAR